MSAIYPSAALKNRQRAIEARADAQVAHITESGRDKYVFMSEEVFERVIDQAVEMPSTRSTLPMPRTQDLARIEALVHQGAVW